MKLLTWNMQGSSAATELKWHNGVMNMFGNLDADIVCLQECGAYPPSARIRHGHNIAFRGDGNLPGGVALTYLEWGTRRTLKHILFAHTDVMGNRVNLAVVSRHAPRNFITANPGIVGARPAIGMEISEDGGATVWEIFTIHALATGGNDARGLLVNINRVTGANWAAAGDFNRDPSMVAIPVGTRRCHPGGPTRLATYTTLDFMVKTGAGVVGSRPAITMSDHQPVSYVF